MGEKETGGQGGTQRANQGVSRHVVLGPCLHVPANATEWTHRFCWHGSASNDVGSRGRGYDERGSVSNDVERKVKNALKFTKLRVCPEQTYFDVEGVRTKDDALVTVKVMIFYRLKDIDTMLKRRTIPLQTSSTLLRVTLSSLHRETPLRSSRLHRIG